MQEKRRISGNSEELMGRGEAESWKTGGAPNQERMKLLVFVPAEAQALGLAVQSVLKPVQEVEIVAADLPGNGFDPSMVPALLARLQPDLLVLCLSPESIAISEVIFEGIHKNHNAPGVLVVLEAATSDRLQRLMLLGAVDFCVAPLRLEDLLPRVLRWAFLMHREPPSTAATKAADFWL